MFCWRLSTLALVVLLSLNDDEAVHSVISSGNSTRRHGLLGILGGDNVTGIINQYGYMAQITSYDPDTDELLRTCAGALIHPDFVLTSAHCFFPVGAHTSSRRADVVMGVKENVVTMPRGRIVREGVPILHPEYTRVGLHHDIALIKLEKPYDLNCDRLGKVKPAEPNDVWYPETCFILGWGSNGSWPYTEVMNLAIFPPLDDDLCQGMSHSFNRTRSLCAGFDGKGSPNICKGDSGAPLLCLAHQGPEIKQLSVFGVASFTKGPCDESQFRPAFMARASFYYDWIYSIVPRVFNKRSAKLADYDPCQ